MEIELERTFLLKKIPVNLGILKFKETLGFESFLKFYWRQPSLSISSPRKDGYKRVIISMATT